MSKLSKKEFLENHSSFPEFHKKILKQGGVEWTPLKNLNRKIKVFLFTSCHVLT